MAEGCKIDPLAQVDESAVLAEGVEVGPFCVVGPGVTIGAGTILTSHVSLTGPTTLGARNRVSPFASIGGPPQDLKYDGEPTKLVVGDDNDIRESVTLNRGTVGGGGVTRLGNGNLLMAYTHIGHDCLVGDRNILANAATLAGHVEIGNDATVGAYSGIHQFCRVADHAFIGGYSVVTQDAMPWVMTVGNRAKAYGLNLVGLKRGGVPRETITALKKAYRMLFRSGETLETAVDTVDAELGQYTEVKQLLEFIRSSERGVCR
ncbi:MAG: acyl-ACP--UDP-N-acetylglucosamine O-acyltransferase [Acidobacteriota bacterium]|nr:acyl-ACP--UDP-N-acetylglucosamine O-acyltransferase [Acidobacteriota bacterium]